MKRILLLFTLLVLLLASCGEDGIVQKNDTPTINFEYEGNIVLNTPEYLVTESEDKFVLYEMESGKRLRKFLDFGEVKFEEDGETKSQYVFLQKTFAYILKDGILETRDFNFSYNEVSVEGNYIILGGGLFDGNLNGVGIALQGEIISQTAFEDGARLTLAYAPPRYEIECVRAIRTDSVPDLTPIYESGDDKLYYSEAASELILKKPNGAYRLNFSISGELLSVAGKENHNIHMLVNDGGKLKNYRFSSLIVKGTNHLSAFVEHITPSNDFFGKTVSSPWVLDKNGKILLSGSELTVCGDVLATHSPYYVLEADMVEYIINSTEPTDEITLYDKELKPINSSPAEIFQICREDKYLTLFDRDTKEFMIVSTDGEIVYQTDHIERPLILDNFGAAVLTKDGKVQFITYDGTEYEELDGWSDALILYTPRQNCIYDYETGETSTVKYWRVIFEDPNDDDSQYVIFRYFPDTGICDTVKEPLLLY